MSVNKVLIVFAKPPIAGLAKTRLIPALGKEGAADFHKKLLNHTLENVVSPDEWDTILWCSENINHPFFEACSEKYALKLREQSKGDLGERMKNAIEDMLIEYNKVCIIGSDCPVLNRVDIGKVFDSLGDENDVVITPAEDGGYVLLAVNQNLKPEIFTSIDWGTSLVTQQTLDRIKKFNLNAIIRPTLWDVDEPIDLSRVSF